MLILKHKWDNPSVKWLEDDIQVAVSTALRRVEKSLNSFTFSSDQNAGKRSKSEGAKKKAMGMRSGETDLRVYLPDGKLWMPELKTKHGTLTDSQKLRHPILVALGHDVTVHKCKTPIDGIEQILMGLSKRLNCEWNNLMVIADIDSHRTRRGAV